MNLHTLNNVEGARRDKKRVGCGESSGHGKTSCRGSKGQMARSGHKRRANFEGGQMPLIRRMPKRGFIHASGTAYVAVNVSMLGAFADGAEVTPEQLMGAADRKAGLHLVKVLGDGEISRKLTVKAHAFSASAKAKIEAAGGTCVVVEA